MAGRPGSAAPGWGTGVVTGNVMRRAIVMAGAGGRERGLGLSPHSCAVPVNMTALWVSRLTGTKF